MAELRHNSEVESTPKTESSEPSGKKVSSEVQEANQSELKPKQTESKESKEETTEKKTDTPPKEEPLEKKDTTVEVPQETKPQEEEKKRPAEDVPLRTETPSVDAEKGNGKLTKEETEALKDKIRADIDSMKESPSGYKDFENGVRDVPTDQPAKLSSKNFDRLAEERGLSPEEAKAQKESFRAFPEQDKSLNNASHHPEKTSADEATIRHVTKDEPVNVYSNEKGASGKYSTHDVYTEPSEVQKNLATPDYNTGEYKNESTLKSTLNDGRQNNVMEGTVAPQKADGKVFTEDRPGGGKQILTDGGYEGGGIVKGETTRLEPSSKDITSVKGIDNEKPLGRAVENAADGKETKSLARSEAGNESMPESNTREVAKQPEPVGNGVKKDPEIPAHTEPLGKEVWKDPTAISSLSEYMSKHNYGPDDFETYSQDPEWRDLQRKAFPDYELPPLTSENAYSQLFEYMNKHNYGPDDFDTYSKDPEWRELQSAAFPDYELPPLDSKEYSSIINALNDANVEHRPIKLVDVPRTTDEIVNRLGGGDLTDGSCSSLAFAYAGNKAGYDVLDFRDGESREFFSANDSIQDIANLPGVSSKTIWGTDDIKCANELLAGMEKGKEYYLGTGLHASIVRNGDNGYEFLELQSANNNGWKTLDDTILENRFGCAPNNAKEYPNFLIDVDSLGKSEEFRDILGYINTAEESQVKGASGHVR